MEREKDEDVGRHTGSIIGGVIVLTLGLLMLADRSGYSQDHLMRYFPGVVLIALGLANMSGMRLRRRRQTMSGLWLMLVGSWLIVSQAHLFGLTFHTSWPILIIGVGVLMVARGLWACPPRPITGQEEEKR